MTALLGTKDAAKKLGVSVQTLANWRYYNRGPKWTRTGRSVKYRESELEAWVAREDVTPAA
jgi:predicted DNA-binding transcriptional regulator AlpA